MAAKGGLEWFREHEAGEEEGDLTAEDVGFQASGEEQGQIFVDYRLNNVRMQSGEVRKVAVSMKALYVLTSEQQVLRWVYEDDMRAKNPTQSSKQELKFAVDEKVIEDIFCDRTGWHCLVTMQDKNTHYVHLSAARAFILHKLNNIAILSCGWNPLAQQYKTEEILVGTDRGQIIVMNIEFDPNAIAQSAVKQPLFARIFDLMDSLPIHGIQYELFPGPPVRYLVLVATTSFLYEFVGEAGENRRPDFQRLFDRYRQRDKLLNSAVHEIPAGNLQTSQLQLYSEENGRAEALSWLAGPGLMHGKLLPSASDESQFIKSLSTLPYPPRGKDEKPVGIGITAHHLYLLYPDLLLIYSKLNQRLVHTHPFETRSGYGFDMKGLVFDPTSQSFFAWNNRFVHQIVIENEKRDVWKYYIEERKFEEAVKFCEQHGSEALPKVRAVYGDYLFGKKKYVEAAEAYANSNRTFEETVLKLISEGAHDALQRFLELKLESTRVDLKTQRTLISTWLVELHISKLNPLYLRDSSAFNDAREVFKLFLNKCRQDLDPVTTYTLLQSHGRVEEWVYFAKLNQKFEMMMLHYINQQDFAQALAILETQMDPSSQESYLCRYAHIFMKNCPKKTVDIMTKLATKNTNFDFSKVLPALMGIAKEHRQEALRFEQSCVEDLKCRDRALHNAYLFHLSQENRPQQLLRYLRSQEASHRGLRDYDFDPEYALAVFKDDRQVEAQISTYSMMQLYSDAVELALEHNKYDLAKENAGKPQEEDEELARKLWLKIALKHLQQKEVAEALRIMRESKLIKMEDLLPHFNEEVSIEKFKDDICGALQDYKVKIEEYKSELEESKKSADLVKQELREIRQRYIELDGRQACELCSKPVMKRHFYLFPCSHAFHKDCLLETLLNVLTQKDRHKAHKLKKLVDEQSELDGRVILTTSNRPSKSGREMPAPNPERSAALQREIDEFLEKQCYLCGDLFIESIGEDMTESQYEKRSWSIE